METKEFGNIVKFNYSRVYIVFSIEASWLCVFDGFLIGCDANTISALCWGTFDAKASSSIAFPVCLYVFVYIYYRVYMCT